MNRRSERWFQFGALRTATVAVEFLITAWLMRNLGPTPFGLLAMADALLALFGIFGDFGVQAALAGRPQASAKLQAAGLLLVGGLGIATALAALLIAPWAAEWLAMPELMPGLGLLALLMLLQNTQTIPLARLQRDRQFATIGRIGLVAALAGGFAAAGAVGGMAGFWVLILRRLTQVSFQLCGLWLLGRPALAGPGRAEFGELLRFGSGLSLYGLSLAVQQQLDKFLVGRALGAQALGLYGFAHRLLHVPAVHLMSIVGTIALPGIGHQRGDGRAQASILAELSRTIATLAASAAMLGVAASPVIIPTWFGTEWEPAVPVVRWLALTLLLELPFQLGQLAFKVSGRSAPLALWSLPTSMLMAGAWWWAAPHGITWVAAATTLITLLRLPAWLRAAAGALEVPVSALAAPGLSGLAEGCLRGLPAVAVWFLVPVTNPNLRLLTAGLALVLALILPWPRDLRAPLRRFARPDPGHKPATWPPSD